MTRAVTLLALIAALASFGSGPARADQASPPSGLDSLPLWQPPAEYHVKMTVSGPQGDAVIDRYISNQRSRMDLSAQGHEMSMIDTGDEQETYYSLMHEQKMAMKDSWKSLPGGGNPASRDSSKERGAASLHATLLGRESLDGRPALKYRVETSEGSATAWFDAALGAPLRMESPKGVVTFSLPEPGPQKAERFEVPRDYQVMDLGAMRSQMSAMMPGGLSSLMGGMGGMGGMGSVSGMAKSRLAAMGHDAATQAGGDLGASLGAGVGGPIGAMVGRYLGQRAAGWLADRVEGKVLGAPSGGGGMAGPMGGPGGSGLPAGSVSIPLARGHH